MGKISSQDSIPAKKRPVKATKDTIPLQLDNAAPAKLRVPVASGIIQINFCKTPSCPNFGVPATERTKRGTNTYTAVSAAKGYPLLRCNLCGIHFPIKSNIGVDEERQRIGRYLNPNPEICCPYVDCSNHQKPVFLGKKYYSSFGVTSAGSTRWKCKACKKTFSKPRLSTHRQRATYKNKLIFQLLVNKSPMRRIVEVAGIGPKSLYGKIDFIYRQCLAFLGSREEKLQTLEIRRLYIGTDRQDYRVNWSQRHDKRNTVLSAVASTDNLTGYCFSLDLNFDPDFDSPQIEADVVAINDLANRPPFRRYARFWLEDDYEVAIAKSSSYSTAQNLEQRVAEKYALALLRDDIEALDAPTKDERLPLVGMQIHGEYTLYAHFLHLKSLLGKVGKFRFFLDQDSGMRAACLTAFAQEIKDRRADAFFVSIAKDLTVDEKRERKQSAKKALDKYMKEHGLSEEEAILEIIKERLRTMREIGKWQDRWLRHPFPDMSEPEKAVSHLTDLGDYDEEHLAWLYNKASLHAVDNVFMRIRRRVMPLERSLHSQGNAGRIWTGYAPYNPKQIQKLLAIFRTFHNFMHVGKDKMTPAMRLGLAKGPVKFEDILYFRR